MGFYVTPAPGVPALFFVESQMIVFIPVREEQLGLNVPLLLDAA